MSIIQGNAHTSAGGYQIERSLRFNSADSARLTRTFGTPTNQEKWTMSMWVKRSGLGINTGLFGAGISDSNLEVWFDTNNKLCFNAATSPDNRTKITTQVFRDCSAWYHLIWAYDTSLPSDSNNSPTALKIYVNNSLITSFSTFESISSYTLVPFNSNGAVVNIGNQTISNYYFSGYMAEIYFIDGQALIPSSFGETDSATGVWKPKAYSGTYGTNGFYLKFADNSGTTSTTLGKDSSSNGNNWTPNNFSVTAGAGNDSLVDSPTPYGTDTGVGGEVRGNYGTWNPLAKGSNTTLSNGNLNVLGSTNSTGNNNFSTFIPSSEKWYFEVSPANTYSYSYVGVSLDGNLSTSSNFVGATASSVGIELGTGAVWRNNSNQGTGGTGVSAGETLMVAFEPSSGKVWAGRNGTWYNSGNPAAGTGQVATIPTVGAIGPAVSPYSSSGTLSFNFGQRAFAYTAPSGFKALCTTNLPTPTIGATSTTQANDYFNAVLWTGNDTDRSITGVGFQPDFTWLKVRNTTGNNVLFDSVRGALKELYSNTTGAESTETNGLDYWESDGFHIKASRWNASPNTYVAWNWNAGGSNATNTSGTITSTVRANTTSGFSIATYTGNGSGGATVGHGLGVSPAMIFIKSRSNSTNWMVWHQNLTANYAFEGLNTTGAEVNGGSPSKYVRSVSSTLVTIGNDISVNQSASYTYVMYCFAAVAGYSAFGSYTGNGSTDGVFVYTGFRPRYVMTKRTDSTSNWVIQDTARDTYNATNNALFANLSLADNTGPWFDILSNGFKVRNNGSDTNASSGTYIYMAFAEVPMKYSLGR